jgi:small GTP-binding protein
MPDIPHFKAVVAGDDNVGKTSLVRRYCEGKFDPARTATVGVDFQSKAVPLAAGEVKLTIWDLAGQDRFQVVRAGMYRGSRAVALVFDLTSPATLGHLAAWRAEIQANAPAAKLLIVGNKTDLAKERGAGREFAASVGGLYVETSALSGEGVAEMFESLAKLAAAE